MVQNPLNFLLWKLRYIAKVVLQRMTLDLVFVPVQSAKILLIPSKCEIILVTLQKW